MRIVFCADKIAMTISRCQQVSLDHTPYYHCISRCVRRAFLCGRDLYSGKDFNHRREWLENRLVKLSQVFAIDLLAYAIMSNHYHVVLRVDPRAADSWTDEEVIERWGMLYKIPGSCRSESQVALWRQRLADLSWFMRCINEPTARKANKEDNCKGRFWEGRFKSQALLDETALLKCMAYVDLNPVRAGIAPTPETSSHTSIKARLEGKAPHLMPFDMQGIPDGPAIPIRQADYLQLVDWSGRALRSDKRGAIPANSPPILDRLHITPGHWTKEMRHYGRRYYRAVGSVDAMRRYCAHLGQTWLKGSGRFPSIRLPAG
jgi:REP element-mobilizing transposase RayT